MGKSCDCEKSKLKRDRKNGVKKAVKDLPFHAATAESPGRLPRDMRLKQREWLLAGLKSIGAPVVV